VLGIGLYVCVCVLEDVTWRSTCGVVQRDVMRCKKGHERWWLEIKKTGQSYTYLVFGSACHMSV
jgi:hypothetical protein